MLGDDGVSRMVLSTSREHRAAGVNVGDRSSRLRGARKASSALRVRLTKKAAYVYGIRGGHVRFVGVTTRSVGRHAAQVRHYVRVAGLG